MFKFSERCPTRDDVSGSGRAHRVNRKSEPGKIINFGETKIGESENRRIGKPENRGLKISVFLLPKKFDCIFWGKVFEKKIIPPTMADPTATFPISELRKKIDCTSFFGGKDFKKKKSHVPPTMAGRSDGNISDPRVIGVSDPKNDGVIIGRNSGELERRADHVGDHTQIPGKSISVLGTVFQEEHVA
jgi:hypothetical protein